MSHILNQNEIRFLQQFSEHEEVASISHLLRALVTGVDLTKDDLLSIEDYLMDRTNEIDNEGLDVPTFFESIRTIVGRLVNAPSAAAPQFESTGFNQGQQKQQPPQQKKIRQPKTVAENTPKVNKKEKYKEAEITSENIPQYLLDIHSIVNQVVEVRCSEEIERRIAAEDKLEKLQNILRGL